MRALVLALLVACDVDHVDPSQPPNILVILVDDLGVDSLALYGTNPQAPVTPTIERLAEDGVMFRNGYASPVCSNTRAGLLTGRLPQQHGFGDANGMPPDASSLPFDEVLLSEAIAQGTGGLYETAAVGKWHIHDLTIPDHEPDALDRGFDHYRGHPENLGKRAIDDDHWESQFRYWKWNGRRSVLSKGVYVTTDEIDDTLDLTRKMQEPWFLYLAPHAAHDPWAPPPAALNPHGVTWIDDDAERYAASVVALDLELGRLFDSMDPGVLSRTTVVLLGDNGTPANATTGPRVELPAKGSVHEGGIHVPFVVSGAAVWDDGRVVDDLVSHVDIFATVLDLARADYAAPESSVSFAPILYNDAGDPSPRREYVYQERFLPSFATVEERGWYFRAARGPRYKLLRYDSQPDTLFDLENDPTERVNLLVEPVAPEVQEAYTELLAVFAEADASYEGPWLDTP